MARPAQVSLLLALAVAIPILLLPAASAKIHRTLHLGPHNAPNPKLIKAGGAAAPLCRGIDHPAICLRFASQLKSGASEKELAKLMAKDTMARAAAAKAMATKLQANKKGMEYQKLEVCKTNFDSMSKDLNEAVKLIDGGKGIGGSTIENHLSALDSYIQTCLDTYAESGGPNSRTPFDRDLRPMQGLIDNLFSLAAHPKK